MSRGLDYSEVNRGSHPPTSKVEFAANLRKAMEAKGWTQAELARQATKFMKKGEVARYSISCYLSATNIPRPEQLSALAKALGVNQTDLLPARYSPEIVPGSTPVSIKGTGNGLAEIQIKQETTWELALSVARMLEGRKAPIEITAHLSALKHSIPKFNLLDKPEKGSYALEISAVVTIETESQELLPEAVAMRDNFYADLRQLLNKYGVISEGN